MTEAEAERLRQELIRDGKLIDIDRSGSTRPCNEEARRKNRARKYAELSSILVNLTGSLNATVTTPAELALAHAVGDIVSFLSREVDEQ